MIARITDLGTNGYAVFSKCRRYRYELGRLTGGDMKAGACLFVMLNPSTADAFQLDPTVRRCLGYATRWGYGSLLVANLFAWRSTDPRALELADDPIGPENDEAIVRLARSAARVVCAWGTWGEFEDRGDYVLARLRREGVALHALGFTKDGHPKHPLYLRRDAVPQPF